jgi:exodeoxyribonuclease V gamma subunit
MFYLHVSNRTENLLRHLVEVIRVGGRDDLFATEVFLIQSQGMERMISQAMAAEFRSWCNFDYLLPFAFLADVAEKLGMPITPDSYDRKVLTWRLDALLRELDGAIYRELAQYIKGENAGLKRFQLSYRLANIFDQYQMMRPDMLGAWDAGRRATDHPSEAWQMALWQRLAPGAEGVPHRGVLLRRVIDMLCKSTDLSAVLPRRISVFGLHIMPALFLECLQGLSRHCDVHLYLLSPCRQYWGDIEGKGRSIKKRLARMEQGLTSDAEAGDRHPLLASYGRQGRDFQEMLLATVNIESEFNSFHDPGADSSPSLLRRLQSDILNDRVSAPGEEKTLPDNSLIILSCHSRLREIEVLKDHILNLLHRDPSLELRDIIVMAPDIHDYASLIPAVFDDIQHAIADRSLRRYNSVINVFLSFLELFDGRFGWIEVLDILKNEAVHPNFELFAADLDSLEHWVCAAGIRWGLSAGQRRQMDLPEFAENTWAFGLDRLLMGVAIDCDETIQGILPFTDIEGAQARALGGLCAFVALVERAGSDFGQERELADWSELLLKYAGELFGEPDREEVLALREMLLLLADTYGRFHHHPVDIRVIRAWLSQSVHESLSGAGFLRGSLTFCSMLPMRSVPFRVVCLLGINDGEFPRNDSWSTFDLMAPPRSRPGDRSARSDDRYQFLEAVLAARDTLLLSYIGRSIKSNDRIPPSVVITELLEYLQGVFGVVDLVVEHPLQPFSSRYFAGDEKRLFSFSRHYCATAARFLEKKEEAASWWSGELAVSEQEPIQVRDLLAFYADPQRWFVRTCLGIRLDVDSDLPEEREPFAVGGLDAYLIEQEIITCLLEGRDTGNILARLTAEGRWTLGAPGRVAFSMKLRELTAFADSIEDLGMGNRIADRLVDCAVGGYHLKGQLSNLHENGVLLARYTALKGKDLLAGWIHHLLLGLFPGESQCTTVIARDGVRRFGKGNEAKPDLIRLLDIYTEGCRRPSPLIVEPAFDYVRQLYAPRASIPPLVKAEGCLRERIDKGYEPEWALLFRNREPEQILDARFEDLCHEIMMPIWMRADAS